MILGFAEVPSNEIYIINLGSVKQVVFRCRHTSSEAIIGWRVNGSSVVQFPNISSGSINENGNVVYTLTIPTRSKYNGTMVVCVAHFIDGNPPESTPPATLTITGLIMIIQVQYVNFPFSYINAVAAPTTLLPTFAPTATRIPPSTGIMIIVHVHVAMHIASLMPFACSLQRILQLFPLH